MLRVAFEEALLFFVPFAIFALYLILRKRNPFLLAHWSDQSFWLVLAGLLCAAAAFLYTGLTAERHQGAFNPTHIENGRVVPGQFR
ncbi:MAG TPA: DUF6111 family protein [Beijerinckiaceae bacterium]|jgi:hypothetical protein|nr:DUF6111 family protein [Beijerinckiaceae bacterium]